jgi:hypothetical protein
MGCVVVAGPVASWLVQSARNSIRNRRIVFKLVILQDAVWIDNKTFVFSDAHFMFPLLLLSSWAINISSTLIHARELVTLMF